MKFPIVFVATAVISAAFATPLIEFASERELAVASDDVCDNIKCPVTSTSPTCGSDGVTYKDDCHLHLAFCKHRELNITKVGDGSCP
ncbi:Kazal-like serine protease inhibitor [Phytophthora megakarya]|uniref:Kazal-like serine protease inhibitor n=1 Tax=Phytophthora megakarya TaxID=4795 RepID=A0A225V778_9STRA|nr:Kazal-like serine protease inhibitor [Phytophthora megakarya]